jgi:RNA polymerase sigma factor (sigma-70 family)
MLMPGGGDTDRQLLDHFVRDQDASAFRCLVARHSAAVHRVCRGVLGDVHEAEDAFQATFLVLARKARVIRDPEALGGWLRGVAYRVAVRARRRAARRRALERARAEMARDEYLPRPPELTSELPEIVRGELERLPESYRQPIELCYLAGLTHQEAARRLNWPVGTVKVRLVRGRRLLRERLDRRGVALGAGVLLMLGEPRKASGVSGLLLESTVRAGALAAAGCRAGLKSRYARALALAEATSRWAIAGGIPWAWIALALAGLSLGLAAPVALAWSGPPAPEVDLASLPANLIDILKVQCR